MISSGHDTKTIRLGVVVTLYLHNSTSMAPKPWNKNAAKMPETNVATQKELDETESTEVKAIIPALEILRDEVRRDLLSRLPGVGKLKFQPGRSKGVMYI